MVMGAVADIEYLPAICFATNEIHATSNFDAVVTYSTTDVEHVAKYTTGMHVSSNVEFGAWTPFILVYAVNSHDGKNAITVILYPSSQEQVATLVTC